ncbi:urea ABC transporter permease UrtB, partial [Thauera aminoaromatica S2]
MLCVLTALAALPARAALDPALVRGLGGDFNARVAAIDALGVSGGDEAAALLDALESGRLGTLDGRVVIVAPDGLRDAASGEALAAEAGAA